MHHYFKLTKKSLTRLVSLFAAGAIATAVTIQPVLAMEENEIKKLAPPPKQVKTSAGTRDLESLYSEIEKLNPFLIRIILNMLDVSSLLKEKQCFQRALEEKKNKLPKVQKALGYILYKRYKSYSRGPSYGYDLVVLTDERSKKALEEMPKKTLGIWIKENSIYCKLPEENEIKIEVNSNLNCYEDDEYYVKKKGTDLPSRIQKEIHAPSKREHQRRSYLKGKTTFSPVQKILATPKVLSKI